MAPKVTIYDVAEAAGVSIKTVSRVMNGEGAVRPETRERVSQAAAALHYRPSLSARSMAGARSYLIGLLFDNPSPAYVTNVQQGVTARCREQGYHVVVESLDAAAGQEAALIDAMLGALRLDGLILTPPVCDNPAVLDLLDQLGAPYVRIAPDREPERAASTSMDEARAAHELTEHLIGLGHRAIGFIKGHPEHGASHRRFEGYAAALRAHGIPLRDDLVAQGYFSLDSGQACAQQLLSRAEPPTAIFASNDDMALGAIGVARRMRLSIPEELSVVGFDDTPSAQLAWPQLTTVRQPIAEMAHAAADLLISGRTRTEAGAWARLTFDFQIVVRDSAAPPGR